MIGNAHAMRRLIERALQENARRTADITGGREVAALGAEYRAVVLSEECGVSTLIKSANPGVAVRPGTRVPVLASGPGLVLETAPPGRGGAFPIESDEGESDVGMAAAAYLAFYTIDSTHVAVKTLDEDGGEVETLIESLTLTSFSLTSPQISLITGDVTHPDNSFTIADAGVVKACDIETGTLTTLYSPSDLICFDGVHYDAATQLVYIATLDTLGSPGNATGKLRSVATDGTGIAVLQTDTAGFPNEYSPSSCVWASDRAILFLGSALSSVTGCVEFPFAGGGAVTRVGDVNSNPVYSLGSKALAASNGRYLADISGSAFVAERMPLTTGSASPLAWPATFSPISGNNGFLRFVDGDLVLYPVLNGPSGAEVNILRTPAGTLPSLASLVEVVGATKGPPTDPFAVIPIPA